MKGFNFEKNLSHQINAVKSVLSVFTDLPHTMASGVDKNYINPTLDYIKGYQYIDNIKKTQGRNDIESNYQNSKTRNKASNIIDVMMETGTGKTYTYTQTIFELNKKFGLFKFVIIVPTLSIKAGTIDFLKSESAREHFKEQYSKTIKLHVIESQKSNKSKKSYMPAAVNSFVSSGVYEKNSIQVMVINAGMINSDTMQKSFDTGLFDKYNVPFSGISAVKPFLIIDEPHKFSSDKKTWLNIQKLNPQFILRYGATFKEYENLVYTLSSVDSFNQNLVKGVIGHITEFEDGNNELVRLINTDGKEATFELVDNAKKRSIKLLKKASLQQLHPEIAGLFVENLNQTRVVLSNGLEMKRGDKINPYSYAVTVQELMISNAIKKHFELEKELLTRDIKIKPLTLFFIDNIDEYRGADGSIRICLEKIIKSEIQVLLKSEIDDFYKRYLEQSLADLSQTHGGYFSKDNSEKDDAIEQEINEILHDKQAILSLDNPRRFIFSKWTLREGWDNPNVFQICKLRSSGSDISKLQEVGRGLRLPVNEYGNRVKDENFYLNYFVDFTENDFIESLVREINDKSGAISADELDKLSDEIIDKICGVYKIRSKEELLETLDEDKVISRSNQFKEGGWEYIKTNYPLIFGGVKSDKVTSNKNTKNSVTIRTEKYHELKELWEKLNEKVILEYKFKDESEFKSLLVDFFNTQKDSLSIKGIKGHQLEVVIENQKATSKSTDSSLEDKLTPLSTMSYSDFLSNLSKSININLETVHQSLIESNININQYLNTTTIRIIKVKFDEYLMHNAIDKFSIEYKNVTNSIHPTKLTDSKGNVLNSIAASDVGVNLSQDSVASNYFFDTLYYDSELEKDNIKESIKEVVVFTKIPKNSIKIPVAGGGSYSPDFAYVIHLSNGEKTLHFVVETKNVASDNNLRGEEIQKIKHAQAFFNSRINISFKTQFSNNKICDLINDISKDDYIPL